jgi:hypothetical protein
VTAETRVALIRALQALADAIRDERHSRMSGEYSDGEMWRVDEAIDYLAAQYDGNISKSSAQNGGAGECIPDYDHEAGKDGHCLWCDQPIDVGYRIDARAVERAVRAEAEANHLRELWDKHGKADLLERAERAEATVDALDKDVASYISDLVDERALADRLAEALQQSWPGISGGSYERCIGEVHDAVSAALAAYEEARGPMARRWPRPTPPAEEARRPISTVTSTGDAE